ncbi:MAG: heme-binding domain-containing protein [Flavobacteriales bacterium]|nr:heme-binding domain-containing protein [Flavobacteriales bacterium]
MKKILYILIAIIVIAQFIRPSRIAEPVDPATDLIAVTKPDAEVEQMLRTSCYDCHSGQPRYPWYFAITPVNWMLNEHIKDGREDFDASTWASVEGYDRDHQAKEGMEELEKKEMPIPEYFYLGRHADAKLTDAQNKKLHAYFKSLRDGSWDIEKARRKAAGQGK